MPFVLYSETNDEAYVARGLESEEQIYRAIVNHTARAVSEYCMPEADVVHRLYREDAEQGFRTTIVLT